LKLAGFVIEAPLGQQYLMSKNLADNYRVSKEFDLGYGLIQAVHGPLSITYGEARTNTAVKTMQMNSRTSHFACFCG